jgi:hypothetical protein
MISLETDLLVSHPPSDVWAVLTDLSSYASWNPFVVSATGTAALGQHLAIKVSDPAGSGRVFGFRPVVTRFEPDRAFAWTGKLGPGGFFDGEHWFRIDNAPGGCRLVHGENFSGLVVALMGRGRIAAMAPGYRAMNEALAGEVSRRAAIGTAPA